MSTKTADSIKRRLKEELRKSIMHCEEHGGWVIDEDKASEFIDTYERLGSYVGYEEDPREILINECIKKANFYNESFIGLI